MTITDIANAWGPLAEPIHVDAMGADSEGPSFGTYDDFMALDSENIRCAGFFEQSILHRVF